jgi:hypothetical protein
LTLAVSFRRDLITLYVKGIIAVLLVWAVAWTVLLNTTITVGPSRLTKLGLPGVASANGVTVRAGLLRGVEIRGDTLRVWRRLPALTYSQASEILLFKFTTPVAESAWARLATECWRRTGHCRVRADTIESHIIMCRESSGSTATLADGSLTGVCRLIGAPPLAVYGCTGRSCKALGRIARTSLGSYDSLRGVPRRPH